MKIISPKGRRFSSINQMLNATQKELDVVAKKVLEQVAQEVKDKMKELIDLFYSQHSPSYYDGTDQLYAAVDNAESKITKSGDTWVIRIQIFNTDSMSQTWTDKKGYFDSYLDFEGHATDGKGKRYTDWAIEWIESGSIFGHKAIPIRQEINNILDKKVQDGILIEMRRMGFFK